MVIKFISGGEVINNPNLPEKVFFYQIKKIFNYSDIAVLNNLLAVALPKDLFCFYFVIKDC